MISIEFAPRAKDISWDSLEGSGKTLQGLTADDFTFRYFMADVTIHDHEKGRILLVTPGLPVIDFVMMLVQMKRETLTIGGSAVETSQTQDSIHAVRQGDSVRQSGSPAALQLLRNCFTCLFGIFQGNPGRRSEGRTAGNVFPSWQSAVQSLPKQPVRRRLTSQERRCETLESSALYGLCILGA